MEDYDILDDSEYFEILFDYLPETVLSQEALDKNHDLMVLISDDLFDQFSRTGRLHPREAAKCLEIVLRHIQFSEGWR